MGSQSWEPNIRVGEEGRNWDEGGAWWDNGVRWAQERKDGFSSVMSATLSKAAVFWMVGDEALSVGGGWLRRGRFRR